MDSKETSREELARQANEFAAEQERRQREDMLMWEARNSTRKHGKVIKRSKFLEYRDKD